MTSVKTSYRLKRFSSSRDPDFAAALLIYVRNTPASIRTDTNEITYWLDQFTAKFGDDFYVFGFYRGRELVGYAEAAYLKDERLIAFDYLTIDEAHRRNNVFYEFVDHLKCYLENDHPEYRYAVAEITYGANQQYPSPESSLRTRLFKLQGFKVIRAPYYQPRMMLDDPESEMKADLLIYSTENLENIQTESYLSIVHTIYYKYYLRWDSVVPDPTDAYKAHLDELYSRIKASIGRKRMIAVNGHKTILATTSKKRVMTLHRIVSFAFQALIVIMLLTASMLGLKAVFRLSNSSFAAIYILAISSFMAVAGIVSKEARMLFAEFVALAKFVFRRKVGGSRPSDSVKGNSEPPDPDGQ
jgi:hypothetical protein